MSFSNHNRGGSYHRSDSNMSNRSSGRRGSRRSSIDPMTLPLEQGIICSLKESFGFIHCAERPEEIFFHYSEVANCHPDDLVIDTEVEFRVGQSGKDPSKRAAFMVNALETGTVVWETEEIEGQFYQGLVERSIRTDQRNNRDNGNQEGSIQVIQEDPDEEEGQKSNKGPLVRFRADDYNPENVRNPRLFKGDLVQFRIVMDRRTKQKYAREITLLQTEKERTRIERERKMLESATEEEGMVISLNKGYGFLKTNRRREHVYFHYSNLVIPEDDDDFELKKGQEMKFLVATEIIDGQSKCRALRLECLPKGSVQFHTVVAQGVKGTISLCPRPPSAGNNPGYADDKDGSIRLLEPIVDKDRDGNDIEIVDVSFEFNDAPGGVYTFQQRGTATNGLWILEGDILLFDVVKELADGSYQAAPTRHTLGLGGVIEKPSNEEKDPETDSAIRLAACSLVSRAEGTMHTLKIQGGYGFIHFAERVIDVHFYTYNLMPQELQADLRKQLGYPADEVKLESGVGVQFDIAQHGVVHAAGRSGGGRRRGSPHERENMKAHRILLLPKTAVSMEKILMRDAEGVVKSADTKQLYAGFLDLNTDVELMGMEERHPLVTKMVKSFVEESSKAHGRKQLVFKDVLSIKEDSVVVDVVNSLSEGKLSCDHIPVAGMDPHPGRLCIRRNESGDTAPEAKADTKKEKQSQSKPNSNIRFDKSSLHQEAKDDMPPNAGDKVVCDVVQSRRTGKIHVQNLRIVERNETERVDVLHVEVSTSEGSGVGIVQNVVPKSNFGFISVLDEKASRQELLFFSLAPDKKAKKLTVRKGDEVKFDIGIDQKTGKRMAQNVQVVAAGTIPSKISKNACRGLILMEPTHTSLSNTPIRKKQSGDSTGSKWGDGKDDPHKVKADIHEKGVILLLEDKTGMFSKRRTRPNRKRSGSVDTVGSQDKSVGDASLGSFDTSDDEMSVDSGTSSGDDSEEFGILCHLPYKNGALAIHGPGSSAGIDKSGNPRRGDLVTFVRGRKGAKVRDIRVETRKSANMLRGRLENIKLGDSLGPNKNSGTATFFAATEKEESYEVDLHELVSCDATLLKEKQQVEGILHDGRIFGLCRTSDLYLESKLGTSHKQRPKLNLSVKKNRGGTIMAQSMMAKGPDGTNGFASGWTTRTSQYAQVDESNA